MVGMQRQARVIDSGDSASSSDRDCDKSLTKAEEVKYLKNFAQQHEVHKSMVTDFTPLSHSDDESLSRRLERGVYARDGLDYYHHQNAQRDGLAE